VTAWWRPPALQMVLSKDLYEEFILPTRARYRRGLNQIYHGREISAPPLSYPAIQGNRDSEIAHDCEPSALRRALG